MGKTEVTKPKKGELPEKRVPALWSTPINKLSMTSMVQNISFGRLGLAVWLCSLPAPAHTLVEYGKPEKVLDFIAATKDTSVINILLVLNSKHNSY